jgi:hypothetical protein
MGLDGGGCGKRKCLASSLALKCEVVQLADLPNQIVATSNVLRLCLQQSNGALMQTPRSS